MARRRSPAFAAAALGLVLACAASANTTTRIHQPGGQGYVDETTNDRGDVIQRETHDASGRLTNDTHYDPDTREPTHSTEHTYDGSSTRPSTTTQRNGEGDPTDRKTFDSNGRVSEHQTYDEDGFPDTRTEFNYDGDGNLTDINVFDSSGSMTTSHHFGWKDGKLTDASTLDHTGDETRTVGVIFYNEDGSIAELRGDVSGALAHVGQSVDPNSHTTTGPDGSRITVRHNPDGTYDVTVVHPDKRVTTGHLRHGAGCYLGDGCPFGSLPGAQQAGGTHDSSDDDPVDEPIAMGPARTGGMPADVHVPKPAVNVHPNVPHGPKGPVSRPTGRY